MIIGTVASLEKSVEIPLRNADKKRVCLSSGNRGFYIYNYGSCAKSHKPSVLLLALVSHIRLQQEFRANVET